MNKYFDMTIELRGRICADSEEAALEICREVARAIADGDVGHLSDHLIDETEAVKVVLSKDQDND